MEKSSFFDAEESPSGEYDREYLAEDFASYFARFISNGVFPNPSTGLQVVASEEPDMSVTLQPGYAYINGYKYENTTPLKFEVDVADGLLERDEAIFIRFSRLDRNIKAYKIKGDPSVSAVTPEVTRTADYWDLCVGIIHVTAGIISIDQSLIEDTRLNTELCGIVTTLVTQVDTTTLYNQIQADLKKFQTVSYQEFADWFEDLKGKLGDDPATALQSQIDNIMDGTSVPNSGVSVYVHSKSGTVHEFTGTGPNGRAKMTADVASGDTFTVNGSPVTAYVGAEDAVSSMAGSAWNGKWVTFVFENSVINFKGGGGLPAADKAKLIPENIKYGVVLFAGTPKEIVGSFTDDGNASAINIIKGVVVYSKGKRIEGTLPPYAGAQVITPKTVNQQIITTPVYVDKALTVAGDPNLVAENIRQGVTIFGVRGTMQPSPQPGTFTAYSYTTINNAMVGYLQGSWGLNTQYRAIYSNVESGQSIGWFSNRLDMTVYRSMAIRKWGGSWAGNRGSYRFGVGRTTNVGEYVKYIDIPATGEGNNNVVYTLDISSVNELCYIKFEGVSGGAAHGFNEVSLSV